MARLLPLLIFGVIVVLFGIGLGLNPREVPSPLIDKPAPAFDLESLADPARRIKVSDFKGQVVLLNVWASWCVSCRQEHPVLLELSKRGVVPLYGLNYKDEREDAQAWLNRFGNPYRDSASDRDGKAGLDWGVYGVPETFVLDKAGRIRHKHTGPVTEQALSETLLPLVARLQQEATP